MSGVTIAAPSALEGARRDQQVGGRRQRGARRGEREERDAGDEHAPAAEAVAEARLPVSRSTP